jgi:hypothetical protein
MSSLFFVTTLKHPALQGSDGISAGERRSAELFFFEKNYSAVRHGAIEIILK